MAIESVTRRNLSTIVADRVCKFIRDKGFKADDMLPPERELARMLGVGRTSLREGLKYVETMGLITIKQGKGMFINEVSLDATMKPSPVADLLRLEKKDLIDLMHVRSILESETARLAAEKATPEQIAQLERALADMARRKSSPKTFIKHDAAFHMAIAEASGNLVVVKLLRSIRDSFMKQQEAAVRLPGAPERAYSYHSGIYEAIKSHDSSLAMERMRQHLLDIENAILSNYQE